MLNGRAGNPLRLTAPQLNTSYRPKGPQRGIPSRHNTRHNYFLRERELSSSTGVRLRQLLENWAVWMFITMTIVRYMTQLVSNGL